MMVRHWGPPGAVIVIASMLLVAGCIGAGTDGEGSEALEEGQVVDAQTQAQSGESGMTAEATEETDEGVREDAPPFYAERTITVEGSLTLGSLPVRLSAIDGPLEVVRGDPGAYALTVTLTGYGYTAQEAQEERDRLELAWDIGAPGQRHLEAAIERHPGEIDGLVDLGTGSWSDAMRLELPPILVDSLEVETRDGDILVEDQEGDAFVSQTRDGDTTLQEVTMAAFVSETRDGDITYQDATGDAFVSETRDGETTLQGVIMAAFVSEARDGDIIYEDATGDAFALEARDGDITLAVGAVDADVGTRDGEVFAEVTPSASGTFTFQTRDGPIEVLVPEGPAHGYEATAESDDGSVSIDLEDGEATNDSATARFVTTGFGDRSIQTILDATNRDAHIRIGPS